MFKIDEIEINGIWGYRTIKSKFNKDVNIFIGINGTGKTTFLNLLEGILSGDLKALSVIQFDKAIVKLKNGRFTRKIEVIKGENAFEKNEVIYKIGTKTFNLPLLPKRFDYEHVNLHPKYRLKIKELNDELNELFNLSWLSVHREVDVKYDKGISRGRSERNTIDEKLFDLIRKLTIYLLQLETESSNHSDDFQRQVFETLLFNDKFDIIDIQKELHFDPTDVKKNLSHAFKDLKVNNSGITKRIDTHVQMLSKAIEKIEKVKKDPKIGLNINDVTPISLFHRTSSIIDFYSEIETKKRKIFEPITNYLRLLKIFVQDKEFELNPKKSGELQIYSKSDTKKRELPKELLSSGEKQLIILLTETLLQTGKSTIFIADEPELSLHISWQKRILSSIKKLNSNAQIIVATHSPEIVGEWQNKIINMESIISHEQ